MLGWLSALALSFVTVAFPAAAAERNYSVSSFDRIRVEGPFEVALTTGKPPGARATADARTLDLLTLRVEGGTLIVRMGGKGWGETPKSATTAPVIALSTPGLRVAIVNAGAKLTVGRMVGQRIDVSVNGSGTLVVAAAQADQLNATLIGSGTMTIGGRAMRARLQSSGAGMIDAGQLTVNDLAVLLDGAGEIRAVARYTAQVTTTGLGRVTVAGNPACTVRAAAGGPVVCGK